MKPEEIAQWVIDNRYAKSEHEKIGDAEMYHTIIEKINQVLLLAAVVGRSEQLTCECVGLDSTECHKINNKWICSKCNRPLEFNFL